MNFVSRALHRRLSLIAWRNNAEVIISTAKCSRFRLITKVTASLRRKFQSLFAKHLNRVHHLLQNLTLRPALWSLLDLYQTGRQKEEEKSRGSGYSLTRAIGVLLLLFVVDSVSILAYTPSDILIYLPRLYLPCSGKFFPICAKFASLSSSPSSGSSEVSSSLSSADLLVEHNPLRRQSHRPNLGSRYA